MALIGLIVVLAAVAFWVVGAYNGLISLKNQVANAWKQIDVQLKRRHDLIPNLVNTVKGAMQFERDTLEAVVTARNKAIAVQTGAGPSGASVAATAAAESQLSGALGRLFAVVEAYPDLKATGNVAQLQEELTSTENKIAFARQLYNDTATLYNTRQRQFPTVLMAGLAGAVPAELWEIADGVERDNVNVDLSMARPAAPGAAASAPTPSPTASSPTQR
jgi:LemA protein